MAVAALAVAAIAIGLTVWLSSGSESAGAPGPGPLGGDVNVGTAKECGGVSVQHPRWLLALLQVDVAPHRSPIVVDSVELVRQHGLRVIEADLLPGGGIGADYFPPTFQRQDVSTSQAWARRQRVGPATLPASARRETVSVVVAVGLAPGAVRGSFSHALIEYHEASKRYVRATVLGGGIGPGYGC